MQDDHEVGAILSRNLKGISGKLVESDRERLDRVLATAADSSTRKNMVFKQNKKLMVCAVVTLTLFFLCTMAYAITKIFLYDSKDLTVDSGLKNAEEKGLVNYTLTSIKINNNINLLIKGVVSDTIRTVLYAEIKGSKENLGLSASLSDINGNRYSSDGVENGTHYSDPEGTFQYRLVFIGGPSNNSTLVLKVNRVGNIKGNWKVSLPVKIMKPVVYDVNKSFVINDTTINVEKVISAASTLEIRYREVGQYLNNVDGSITAGNMKARLVRGSLSLNNNDNTYTGSAFYDPIDLTKTKILKWSIYTDYASKTPIKIEIPIKQAPTR